MSTKLEMLFASSVQDIIQTWFSLGGLEATPASKVYTKGMLYRVVAPDAKEKINNALVFCNEDYIGKLDWNSAVIMNPAHGELSFGNTIISPIVTMVLSGDMFDDTIVPDDNFIPFSITDGESVYTLKNVGDVIISDSDYQQCIKCLGAPFVQEDELEYSKEEIINLAIKPALDMYFKWFPKVEVHTYPATGALQEVDFPKDAYDIVRADVQQMGSSGPFNGPQNVLLRYWDESLYGGFGAGSYYGYGMTGSYSSTMGLSGANATGNLLAARAVAQGLTNYMTRVHIDRYQRPDGTWYAQFYSSKGGTVEIYYAMRTYDFNNVEFARRPEVLKLCSAFVKELFANVRRQIKSDIPGAVDYSGWLTEAQTEKKEVEEDFKQLVKASSCMRGSL